LIETSSLTLQAVRAAKFSLRACRLQSAQSAELIFHKLKMGSSQEPQEHASL